MKRIVVLLGLSVMACGNKEFIQQRQVAINDPPPRVGGCTSNLAVPKTCPVWAPGGGEIDTIEPAFLPGIIAMCGVDSAEDSYGLVMGDAPTAQMAVLPGNREIGVYLGFDASAGFTPDKVALSGSNANFLAWAGPFRRENGELAEEHPEAQRPLTVVAVGERGVLFSLGSFDTAPLQVAFILQDVAPSTSYTAAFYVNGTP